MATRTALWVFFAAIGLAFCGNGQWTNSAWAQLQPLIPKPSVSGDKPVVATMRDQFLASTDLNADKDPFQFSAAIRCEQAGQPVYLVVTAKLAPGCHLYSLTQPDESATKLEVAVSELYRITGPFRPRQAPHVTGAGTATDPIQETYAELVEFVLPIELALGADLKKMNIDVRINGQVCQDDTSCQPIRNKIVTAKFSGFDSDLLRLSEKPGTVR